MLHHDYGQSARAGQCHVKQQEVTYSFSTSHSLAPFHTDVLSPAAPQLKPRVCLVAFCSLRRLPTHTRVTGTVREGREASSAIENFRGRRTRPVTSTWNEKRSRDTRAEREHYHVGTSRSHWGPNFRWSASVHSASLLRLWPSFSNLTCHVSQSSCGT